MHFVSPSKIMALLSILNRVINMYSTSCVEISLQNLLHQQNLWVNSGSGSFPSV
jgi:hypothetical protein